MRRFPSYLVVALCGLLMFSFGVMSMFRVDAQTQNPLVPTVMAMLTQMPPEAVATQLAQQGHTVPASVQSTAQAMYQQGIAPAEIIRILLASYGVTLPTQLPTTNPSNPLPAQPTTAAPVVVQPVVQPPVSVQGTPSLPAGLVPIPTALPNQPAATQVVPSPAPVDVGTISGSIQLPVMAVSDVMLILTRPDSSTLELPVAADGLFTFANMLPGAYILEASAVNHLSSRTEFTLEAGQMLELPNAVLQTGDTNGDNVIDLMDAALIASNFDTPAVVKEADLNGDGWIDVRDLTVIGKQFGTVGPTSWG